jgi:hypothetical protein
MLPLYPSAPAAGKKVVIRPENLVEGYDSYNLGEDAAIHRTDRLFIS